MKSTAKPHLNQAALLGFFLVACTSRPNPLFMEDEGDGGSSEDGGTTADTSVNTSDAADTDSDAGDGSTNFQPMLVAGNDHTCVLLEGGLVRCWGRAEYGQLGYGNTNSIGDDELPSGVETVSVGGTVVQLVARNSHTCALLEGGFVRCWGKAESGQLGYGNINIIGNDELPSSVGTVSVGGTVVQLVAGTSHTCALLEGGTVRCWGLGIWGQLGYGNQNDIGDDELPSSVGTVSVGSTVVQLVAGANHTCALLEEGTVRCWGSGTNGQLGYGNVNHIGDDELPSSVGTLSVGGTVVQLAASGNHTCALLEGGLARCWGWGEYGGLGYGGTNNIGDDEIPSSVGTISVNGVILQLSAGGSHTCALLDDDSVRCWGKGDYGQLGYGNINNIGDDELPSSIGTVSVDGAVVQLAAGINHTCAVLDGGIIRCWGRGEYGRLGYGNINNIGDDELPSSVMSVQYQ